jgi:4-amino-4-deoxy-L-arabinose transferase-like glycosyltransferase
VKRLLNALPFASILLIYLLLGALYATRIPAWQAPDEPAHYNYVRQVAEGTLLPVIQMGDWDNAYLDALKAARFAPELLDELESVRYENHQPPLYYWLSAPIYTLTDGDLMALRFVSVLLGAGVVVLAYAVAREVYPAPERSHIALGAMAFVAFLPQHIAILSSVNNDALAWLLIALTLWALLRYIRQDRQQVRVWHLGVLVGLLILSKTTAYFLAGLVPLVLILHHLWLRRDEPLRLPYVLLTFARPVALACLFWFGRNVLVYGFPDILGLGAHDAVVVGQPRTADRVAALGFDAYLRDGLQTTFNSFFGQFGWMGVPMQPTIYALISRVLALIGVGWLLGLVWRLPVEATGKQRSLIWLTLFGTLILGVLAYLYYNSEYVQFQGRYLFTGLLPVALLLALGLDAWRRVLLGRFAWSRALVPLAFLPLALLAFYMVWRVLPGALSPEFL